MDEKWLEEDDGDEPEDAPVGYGRPPRQRRFGAGADANPRYRGGRRKHNPDARATVIQVLSQTIVVKDGHRSRRITRLELVIRAMRGQVARGSLPALRLYERLCSTYRAFDEDSRPRAVLILPEKIHDFDEWCALYGPGGPKYRSG